VECDRGSRAGYVAYGLACLWLSTSTIADATSPTDADSFSVTGSIAELHLGLSNVTIALDQHTARFRITNLQASTSLLEALVAARGSHANISLEFDPARGFIGHDVATPTFPVKSIVYQGQHRELPANGVNAPPPQDVATTAFIRSVAEFEAERYWDAVDSMNSALASGTLPSRLRATAFKVRGESLASWVFYVDNGPTTEGDVRLVAALKDLVEWANLSPDDVEARYQIAGVLRLLGGYDEALSVLHDTAAQWPEEHYWAAMRINLVEREQGHYADALKSLDDLVLRFGQQRGMPFHYHRAGTLLRLNRPADAVREVDEGLKFQPDYAWAYILRSCAYASQGMVMQALEDQTKALSLMRALPPRGLSADRFDLERATAVERGLADEVASGQTEARKESCGGYWRQPEHARTRSPALPTPAVPKLPPHVEKSGAALLLWIGLLGLLGGGAIGLIVRTRRSRSV
jgi:tetratricopeptide (TPR) repeat protein